VRKDVLNQLARTFALQSTTEDEAKALIDKLTDIQVKEFEKEFRSDVDKEVSNSNKTLKENLEKEFDFVKKNQNPDDDSKNKGGDDKNKDVPEWAKTLLESNKALSEKLSNYEKNDVAKTRLQTLNDKLTGCKDENFKAQTLEDFARMQFDTDEAFNEYLTKKETAITTANQNVANTALGGQTKPLFTAKNEQGVSKGVAEFVESQKPDSKQFSGKEV
jgi:hypothetical protein